MAKERPIEGVPEPDTANHATIDGVGAYGQHRDRLYVPGEGIYLSRHAEGDLNRECTKAHKAHGGGYNDQYHSAFIDEATIEHWHRLIRANKTIAAETDRCNEGRRKYEAGCYDGTDTEDPTRQDSPLHDKANSFRLDRSGSTISLSTCSGGRYLNGSAVDHQHYIHIVVHSPDRREICDVAMTFDQFASFLVSNMATPCTVDSYWSINDQCVRLCEVVKTPQNINERMSQRLHDRLDDIRERMDGTVRKLQEQIATGKAMSRTKLEEIVKELHIFGQHFDSNRDFTVKQAQEEVSSIVEQAACSIAWEHKLGIEELRGSPAIRALIDARSPQIALPPKPE